MGATLGSDQYNDTHVDILLLMIIDDDVVGVDDDDRRPPCRCQ